MDIKDYLRIVRRRFWLILAVLAGTALSFYAYQAHRTLLYQSTVEMAIKHPPNFVILTAMNPAAVDALSYEAQLNLLDTPDVLKEAIRRARQENGYKPVPYLDPNPNVAWEGLRGMMDVESTAKTGIIRVSITSADPAFSQLMANSVGEAFKYFVEIESKKIARKTLEYIRKAEKEEQMLLDKKNEELRRADQSSYLQNLLSAGSKEMEELKRWKQELSQAREEQTTDQTELEKYNDILNRNNLDSILQQFYKPSQALADIERQKVKLQEQLIDLRRTETDLHPEVIQTIHQLDFQTQQEERLEKEALAEARLNAKLFVIDQVTQWGRKKQAVEKQIQDLEKKVNQQNYLVTQEIFDEFPFKIQNMNSISFFKTLYHFTLDEKEKVKEIQSSIQMIQTSLGQLTNREKDLEIQTQMRGEIVEIIRKAGVGGSINQFGSREWMLALIVGIILGLTGAYFVENLTTTVRTEQDIRKYSNLETLAVVPYLKDSVLILDSTQYTPIMEMHNMTATLIESYLAQKGIKTLLITSSRAGQGKSVMTLNLGAALARSGHKTIVVDCDLRKASLRHLLDINPSYGLTDYLVDQTEPIPWDRLLTPTSVNDLFLLASTVIRENPLSLLKLERCKNLFKELRHQADVILVDAPPIHFAPDPVVLTKYVDSIVLVVASGDVDKDELKYTKHLLESVGGNIMGVILNKAVIESRSYYYYYYHGYPKYSSYYGPDRGYKKIKEL